MKLKLSVLALIATAMVSTSAFAEKPEKQTFCEKNPAHWKCTGVHPGGNGGAGGNGGGGGAGGNGGNGGAGGNATAGAIAVAGAAAGAIATGGNATGGSVGPITVGPVSSSIRDSGNSTNLNLNSNDNRSSATGGSSTVSVGGQTTTVGGQTATNTTTVGGQSTNVSISNVDPNSRANAEAAAQATRDAANAMAEAVRQAAREPIKNTPSMDAPALTSSNDTCMGSISGSVSLPGFGLGAGATMIDENCVMLKNSRELWNMGMKAASLARMCMDDKNREALEITGYTCPPVKAKKEAEAKAEAAKAPAPVNTGS